MPELYSYTGARVAADVQDSFGDTGQVQLTQDMLLRWINDGQRQVAQDSDFTRAQALAPLIAGQAVYDLSDLLAGERLKQVESVVVGGKRLQLKPFSEYMELLDGTTLTAAAPTYGMIRGDALNLHPVPSATLANGITLYYTQWPLDLVALTDPLTVPDRYYVVLRDWVLAQAYQLDDDLEGSQIKLNQAVAGMQSQYERENRSPTDIYPVVPDSEEWV